MKRLLTAMVLALALSTSAVAGDIPISGSSLPAPSGTTQARNGEIRSVPGQIPTVDYMSDVALSAVLTVLSLLS